jgi:mannitol-specific phosphotransferase system IIBC component
MTKGKGVFKKVALSIATIIVGFIVTIVILARNEESQMSMDINVAEVDIKGEEFDRKQVKKEIEEDKEAEKYRDKRATRKKMVFDMDALQGEWHRRKRRMQYKKKKVKGRTRRFWRELFLKKGKKKKIPDL